jgi:hypothetical protein
VKFTIEIPDEKITKTPEQTAAWIALVLDGYFGDGFHQTVTVDGRTGDDYGR